MFSFFPVFCFVLLLSFGMNVLQCNLKFDLERNGKDLAKLSLAIPPQLIRLCQTVSFVFLEKQIDLLPGGYKFLTWPSGQVYLVHLLGTFAVTKKHAIHKWFQEHLVEQFNHLFSYTWLWCCDRSYRDSVHTCKSKNTMSIWLAMIHIYNLVMGIHKEHIFGIYIIYIKHELSIFLRS